jgi:SAM-dependent methyltransferase
VGCCQCRGAEAVFDQRMAKRDLWKYRKSGPGRTTRILIEALVAEGVKDATLLDIGGGVGAIPNALLDAGVREVTAVDASGAYLRAAREEARRQGHREQIAYHHGDFVELAPEIPAADLVTLDRAVCCYHDMEALVGASAERAERLYGLVYPRDTWWNRLGISLINFALRLWGSSFRVFVHAPPAVDRVIAGKGLERRFYRETLVWQVVVYARR